MKKEHYTLVVITIMVTIISVQSYFLNKVAEIEVENPEPVCTTLECEVERRTATIFERDRSEYMETSRLKALSELNQEMMEMTSNPEKRLNN